MRYMDDFILYTFNTFEHTFSDPLQHNHMEMAHMEMVQTINLQRSSFSMIDLT